MAKVVIKKLVSPAARAAGRGTVAMQTERVDGVDGPREIAVITTDPDSFGRDLTFAFKRNVRKARLENKRVTGELDRAPAKA